jgi:hypothetical protein
MAALGQRVHGAGGEGGSLGIPAAAVRVVADPEGARQIDYAHAALHQGGADCCRRFLGKAEKDDVALGREDVEIERLGVAIPDLRERRHRPRLPGPGGHGDGQPGARVARQEADQFLARVPGGPGNPDTKQRRHGRQCVHVLE